MKKLKEIHDETLHESQPEKRFAVTMDFYVWAKDEATARRIAEAAAKHRRDKFDDQAKIIDFKEMPYGKIG